MPAAHTLHIMNANSQLDPPTRRRAVWIVGTFLIAGVLSLLIIDFAPVIGLTASTKPVEAYQVVLSSTSLWVVALSVLIALISAVWVALRSPTEREEFWTQLLNVLAAFLAFWAGVFAVPPIADFMRDLLSMLGVA